MPPEYDNDGNQLSPQQVADRNKKRQQQEREQRERETAERLRILRTNEDIAEKVDGLQERLQLNSELDEKIEAENAAYVKLKSKTEEYRKILAEMQARRENEGERGGGDETEILELLSSVLDLEDKLKETEREKTQAVKETERQKWQHEREKTELNDQLDGLREFAEYLNDQLRKRSLTRQEYEDETARLKRMSPPKEGKTS